MRELLFHSLAGGQHEERLACGGSQRVFLRVEFSLVLLFIGGTLAGPTGLQR